MVFSELAIRRCEDAKLKPQLEKIHGAAEQARDLLVEIRNLQNQVEPNLDEPKPDKEEIREAYKGRSECGLSFARMGLGIRKWP